MTDVHDGNTDPGIIPATLREDPEMRDRERPRLVHPDRRDRGLRSAWQTLPHVHQGLVLAAALMGIGFAGKTAWDTLVAGKADASTVEMIEQEHHVVHERQDRAIIDLQRDTAVTAARVDLIGQDTRAMANKLGIPAPVVVPHPTPEPVVTP